MESNHGINSIYREIAQEQWLMLGIPKTKHKSAKVGSVPRTVFDAQSYRFRYHFVLVRESCSWDIKIIKQLQVSPPILKDLAVLKLRTDVPSTHHTRHSFEHLLNIGFEKSGHRSLT